MSRALKDELASEYQFNYRKAKPNRFADRRSSECLVVTLDPDVSQVFTTPEAVNTVLRTLIAVMPVPNSQKPGK